MVCKVKNYMNVFFFLKKQQHINVVGLSFTCFSKHRSPAPPPHFSSVFLPQGHSSKRQDWWLGQGVRTVNLFISGFTAHSVNEPKQFQQLLQISSHESETIVGNCRDRDCLPGCSKLNPRGSSLIGWTLL